LKKDLEFLLAACKEKKTIITILEIGGENSYQPPVFSKMAQEPARVENFISTVMKIVNKYEFGGLLIDWVPEHWVSKIQKCVYFCFVKLCKTKTLKRVKISYIFINHKAGNPVSAGYLCDYLKPFRQ
jgi:GH18 family chitinase